MYVMKERQKRRFFDDVESSREKISFFIVCSCGFVLVVSSSVLFCFVLIVFLFYNNLVLLNLHNFSQQKVNFALVVCFVD